MAASDAKGELLTQVVILKAVERSRIFAYPAKVGGKNLDVSPLNHEEAAGMVMNWSIRPDLGDQRVLVAGKWLPLRALGWMAAMMCAIVFAFWIGTLRPSHILQNQAHLQFAAQLFGALIILGTYAGLVMLGERRSPSELAIKTAPFEIIAGLALGSIIFAMVMVILVTIGAYEFKYLGPAPVWRGAGLALQSSVFEEVLARGVVFRLLWRAFGPAVALFLSAIVFGVAHIANPEATLVTTACVAIEAGIMLASFYALTGRLWISIGVHAGWNFSQGYLFGAPVSGDDFGKAIARSSPNDHVSTWITGGGFGPEASLSALMVCSVIGAIVMGFAWRLGRFSKLPNLTASSI